MIKEYIMVVGYGSNDFNHQIKHYLMNGWRPYGDPLPTTSKMTDCPGFAQAMVKLEEDE